MRGATAKRPVEDIAAVDETYHGNTARALVDDALWAPLEEAIRTAHHDLALSQLLFESAFKPRSAKLADLLEGAAALGVRVRILANENAIIPDSADEMRQRYQGSAVEVRALRMTPNVLHMKVLLVDGAKAFLLDAPFEQKYVDGALHAHDVGRRDRATPLHSVSLQLEGPCVARVMDLYEALWHAAADLLPPPLPARPAGKPRGGGETVQLAWSAPAGLVEPAASHRILEAYEEAIGRARELVYIENQYFTSPRITRALRAALERERGLEAILVLNVHMDVPTYDTWQAQRLDELGRDDERVGVFAMWRPEPRARVPSLRPLYVHSKVCIVDDAWATVGSANLDSISLHDAEEFLVPAPPNVELNAVIPDPAWATDLRRRLWAEHLGDDGGWRATPPRLDVWRRVAQRNLAAYHAGELPANARVFPHAALAKEGRKPLSARRKAP